jgi:hypothetical protein
VLSVRTVRTLCVVVGVLIGSVAGVIIPALASEGSGCGDVTLVFARGSGQS